LQKKRLASVLNSLLCGLADLVYPKICVVCKNKLKETSVANLVCLGCWDKIKKNRPPFCRRCGRGLEKKSLAKNICVSCLRKPLEFDRAFAPCVYEGTLKELIHQFKYNNRDYLGAVLAKFMVDFIRQYDIPMDYLDLIIPVPLHAARLREREFNQAQILSDHIAAAFGKKVLNNTLVRQRYTKTQTELKDAERFSNVKESFTLKDAQAVKSKNILLVDDVLTTGATSSEAALALKTAGANIIFVLTLAN
jgi:competence protein ComFC